MSSSNTSLKEGTGVALITRTVAGRVEQESDSGPSANDSSISVSSFLKQKVVIITKLPKTCVTTT